MKKTPLPAEDNFSPEAVVSILNSSILFCNVIVTGKDSAAGLKYDDENMFAPMIVFLEKDASASTLILAAETLGVPVVENEFLIKNLFSYGKAGSSVPESCFRDVSLVLTRTNFTGQKRLPRSLKNIRRASPIEIPPAISVEMGDALFALSGEGAGRKVLLFEPLENIRKKLVKLLGFEIPRFRISKNPSIKTDEYRILFKGLEAGQGRLEMDWYSYDKAELSPAVFPALFPEMMMQPENIHAAAAAAVSTLVRHVNAIIQRRAPELLGRDEVDAILEAVEEKYPVVTTEVRSLLPLGIIREIFQNLVSEQVSIQPISVILETLADWGHYGPTPNEFIIEQIRISLRRQICMDYAGEGMTLRVLTLSPDLEKAFANNPSGTAAQGTSPDNSGKPEILEEIIFSAVSRMEEMGCPPVILCSPKARFPLKESTRKKSPYLAVLSYVEIPSDIKVEPVGEISIKGSVNV